MPQLVTSRLLGPGSKGVLVEGYLTEWRSFGGASGSPVFVYFPPDRVPNVITVGTPTIRLLGLIHGHIEIRQEVEYTGESWSKGTVDVNSGVAVVIPAKTIKEVLMTDRLVEDRRETLVRVRRIQAAAGNGSNVEREVQES